MSAGRPTNYGAFTAAARKANMTRAQFAKHLVAIYGTQRAAAEALGFTQGTIRTALHHKPTGRNRIMILAERAGMTTANYAIMVTDQYGGDTNAAAKALKISASGLRRYLKHDTLRAPRPRSPMPEMKRRRIIKLLQDGFTVAEVARLTETSSSTVRYWHAKLARMKAKMRRAA